jgi:hypothetical protein
MLKTALAAHRFQLKYVKGNAQYEAASKIGKEPRRIILAALTQRSTGASSVGRIKIGPGRPPATFTISSARLCDLCLGSAAPFRF